MTILNEAILEKTSISHFEAQGYTAIRGTNLTDKRGDFRQTVLKPNLADALRRVNPLLSSAALEAAQIQLLKQNSRSPVAINKEAHDYLKNGVLVEYFDEHGRRTDFVKILDFDCPDNNEWLIVDQLTIQGNKQRRPDLIVFVNGLPLAVFELKNPADVSTNIWKAYEQLQCYKTEIPDLFQFNVLLGISDGVETRVGSLTADQSRFLNWRTIDGVQKDPCGAMGSLETTIAGVFHKERFLDLIRNFVIFESTKSGLVKKVAAYHQFHAVRKALAQALVASSEGGDRKGGVVWHTQGAGKSIEMLCFASKLLTCPELANPTIVVATDRIDLHSQLFGVFSSVPDFLPETPVQAKSRPELRKILNGKKSGGLIFTTIQKFSPIEDEDTQPELCGRSNVIVIVDEAHRSQYGFGSGKGGYAQHLRDALPNATYTAFTGTPVALVDKDTQAVFGGYVDKYKLNQAVEDNVTVPVFYEARLSQLHLDIASAIELDASLGEEDEQGVDEYSEAKAQAAGLETIIGANDRIKLIVADMLAHFDTRTKFVGGKALFVAASREICVRIYDQIIATNPDWHSEDPLQGAVKVLMTSHASDSDALKIHAYSEEDKRAIERRLRDPSDPLKLVIVRNMLLTGFDAPCLNTLYVDRPLSGHNLMQTVARVNRVFGDKAGGLIVDYLGISEKLQQAAAMYAGDSAQGSPVLDLSAVYQQAKSHLEEVRTLLEEVDYSEFRSPPVTLYATVADYVLGSPARKQGFADHVFKLTQAYKLCGTVPDAATIRAEVAFLQTIRNMVVKHGGSDSLLKNVEAGGQLKQLASEAISIYDKIVDPFEAIGLEKPSLSDLSDAYWAALASGPEKNLRLDVMEQLLRECISTRFGCNAVRSRKFSELIEEQIKAYHQRALTVTDVIGALQVIAKALDATAKSDEALGLSPKEASVHDILVETGISAEGQARLTAASAVVAALDGKFMPDWQDRPQAHAALRLAIKKALMSAIPMLSPASPQAKAAVQQIWEQIHQQGDSWLAS